MRLFEHLRELPGPLRVPDLQAYVRELGFSPDLVLSNTGLQATPMRRRGVHVGDFFLAGKKGGQAFTADDEDLLVLFASQAANAVANARTHRDEQRARADLEALVETSPVGVTVFDAATAHPVSFNREARRLAGRLSTPGPSPEELLDALTCGFSDGREVALVIGLGVDDPEELPDLGGLQDPRGAQHGGRRALDRGERRAQLATHHLQESRPAPVPAPRAAPSPAG